MSTVTRIFIMARISFISTRGQRDTCVGNQHENWFYTQFCKKMSDLVSRHVELNGRRYWILSEPRGSVWRASVVELVDAEGELTEPVGIEGSGATQGAADLAAERKLRRLLRTPDASSGQKWTVD